MPAFHTILSTKWEPDDVVDTQIVHAWLEDGSKTVLIVPRQLRDDLVALQNWLHEKYKEHGKLVLEAKKIEDFFGINRG